MLYLIAGIADTYEKPDIDVETSILKVTEKTTKEVITI